MDPMDTTQQLPVDPLSFARNYQLEALEAAIKQNTIVFLETGSGKTLIAIMLLRYYAHQLRKPSSFFAVFLVPTVVLVTQDIPVSGFHGVGLKGKFLKSSHKLKLRNFANKTLCSMADFPNFGFRLEHATYYLRISPSSPLHAFARVPILSGEILTDLSSDNIKHKQSEALMMHTDLKVGKFWGDLGVDYWDAAIWKQQVDKYEVLVMTPKILLDALRHSFLTFEMIKVLIFDECHNARGRHPYACIMTEFYHERVNLINSLPRIFGMTASPIKAKGSFSESANWLEISELETLMNSKVYTCASESVLAAYIPFSTPKLKYYDHRDIPNSVYEGITNELKMLKQKYEHDLSLASSSLSQDTVKSARKRLVKLFDIFLFCLRELGVWLAFKAAESSSHVKTDIFLWEKFDTRGEAMMRNFSLDSSKVFAAWIPSDHRWSIGANTKAHMDSGYVTAKVVCLVESLIEYRELKELRCIVFVDRIITAIVLQTLLNELFSHSTGWRASYTAGNNQKCLQSQSRKDQNKIVEEFRRGQVNIIVATSMLEEGLDVQSCNLVIRFDPSATVCSFIQSRGRARMQNSVFLIMVKSGDVSTLSRMQKYLHSGEIMRKQSLSHGSEPCMPLNKCAEACYKVETTGAVVNLSSSVSLLHFYCDRLPSDGYFKPSPRYIIDKASEICTIHLPRNCPLQQIVVHGQLKTLKQLACLEACKQLHEIGALTDHLIPDIVEEEGADTQDLSSEPYIEEHVQYVPPQLVSCQDNEPETFYYCYLIELEPEFEYTIKPHAIWLAVKSELQLDTDSLSFDLHADRGCLRVKIRYLAGARLTSQQVLLCQMFQTAVFRVLIDHDLNRLQEIVGSLQQKGASNMYDFLLLPSSGSRQKPLIDWTCVCSVQFSPKHSKDIHLSCCPSGANGVFLNTYKEVPLCRCVLQNCLVYTPHNKRLYCISEILDAMDGNSLLNLKDGQSITYKTYYKQRHGVDLLFNTQPLLRGKPIFTVQNYLQKCRNQKVKDSTSNTTVELPPELCYAVMSPISVPVFYSFSYCPSILHRIESLLLAADIKRMNADLCMQNDVIPTIKILEAITTKKCQEIFHLESLETLGDSFLKYAVSRQLFMTYEKQHEGLLSIKRERIISNASLCKLGCLRKIPGYICNEPFDPKTWIVPGDKSAANALEMECNSPRRIFFGRKRRKIRSKTVADVVEALIGAFLSCGGEGAALSFMKWLGIKVDLVSAPYTMPLMVDPGKLINVNFFKSLLNYSFREPSILVEALTHGSYMLPEIPRCYQRLEFLGDAVLDYLITELLYRTYPGASPGLLTDLRSASVNNDYYAQCALKMGLHNHILHTSQELHQKIGETLSNFDQLSAESSFGWESESIFPKVLGDVIESIGGALFVDSGYKAEIVFQSMKPLLGPMITPDMLKLHPIRELTELCQREHYIFKKPVAICDTGKATVEVEVEADGTVYTISCSAADKKSARKLACQAVLKSLKERLASKQG